MKTMACALLLMVLFTGCARMSSEDVSASPASGGDKVSCEASGGKWNGLTRGCDR